MPKSIALVLLPPIPSFVHSDYSPLFLLFIKSIKIQSNFAKELSWEYVVELIKKWHLEWISTLLFLIAEQYRQIPHGSSSGHKGGYDFIFGTDASGDASTFFALDGDFANPNFDDRPSYLLSIIYISWCALCRD